MRYYIPEWDDRVDPDYDFLTDEHSQVHRVNPFSDHYMWDLFPGNEVPFDGVLVSRAKLEQNRKKLKLAFEEGIRKFLHLPASLPLMGDCGAWGYIEQDTPPYDAVQILDYYQELGFDIGVTVDHLVVPKFSEQRSQRIQVTFENGLKGFEAWQKKYRQHFRLLVAVQGWEVQDYIKMYLDYYRHGARDFAFGGLARSPTPYIKSLIDELEKTVAAEKAKPEHLHFFGLGRFSLFEKFKALEEQGIEISFDTASWLRRAWLSGINYYAVDDQLKGYRAIRISQTGRRTGLRGKKKLGSKVDTESVRKAEQESLSKLRSYDKGKLTIQPVIETLREYVKLTGLGAELENHYRETLTDMPWKKCDCPICKSIGIEALIFRGNNRNRRRGFHNTYVVYHKIIKHPELWPKFSEEEYNEGLQMAPEELQNLAGRVLVVTECTKDKKGYDSKTRTKAEDMYQGQLFRAVKNFVRARKFDYLIISAKYGLLRPDEVIEGYEKVLKSKEDVEAIRGQVESKLKPILDSYDRILVIAGARYRQVLRNIWDDRFLTIKSRGYGDLCRILKLSLVKPISDYTNCRLEMMK